MWLWHVSLQVMTDSRPGLKHQLNFQVRAPDEKLAVEAASKAASRDGHAVVSVVAAVKGRRV